MIDIKKGSRVLRVSKCAYNDTFKKLGYKIVSDAEEEVITPSSDKTNEINNREEKLIEEEKENNKEETELQKDVTTSDDLKVNVIGENITNFDNKKEVEEEKENNKEETKENSLLEKVLQQKESKSKGK